MSDKQAGGARWENYWMCDPRYGMGDRPWWWRMLKWAHLSRGWNISRLPDMARRIGGYGEIDTIVDVGVCWGTPALWLSNPDANLVLIDPGRVSAPANRGCRIIRAAAGENRGTVLFDHIMDGNEGASKTGSGQPVQMIRVDELHLSGTIGLKVDVEGNEMSVLRGCEGIMNRVQWAIVEMNLGEGDCPTSQMIAWFAWHGLELYDTIPFVNPDAAKANAVDGIFRRINNSGTSKEQS